MLVETLRGAGRVKPGLVALFACLIAVGIAAGAGAPEGITAPDPVTCSGYPEPRVFLESQAWWADDEVSADGGTKHVHSGVCMPLNGVVSGKVTFDVVSKLHNYQGWNLRFVRIQSATDQGGVDNVVITSPGTVCNSHDCTFVTPITIDTDALATGRHEFRIHSEARPGVGSAPKNLATNGWQVCIRSCSGVTPQATDNPEGRGWYHTEAGSDKGYVNGRFNSQAEFPWQADKGFVPVSGQWCPPVRILRGAGDDSVDRSRVVVDPDFHAGKPGITVLDQPGSFEGRACVDTTKLGNGQHKLVLIAHTGSEFAGQLAGVFVVPFVVANGGTPPPPTTTTTTTTTPTTTTTTTTTGTTTTGTTTTGTTTTGTTTTQPPPADVPPTVLVMRPSAGQTVSGMTTLDVSASTDTMRVAYLVDGVMVAEDTSRSDFAEEWNTSSVANGLHRVVARAADAAGNSTDSEPISFRVQNAAPTGASVVVKNPAPDTTINGKIRLDVTTTGDIRRVEYLVDGIRVAYDNTPTDFSEDWTSSKVRNGEHVLSARARDARGTWHQSPGVRIMVLN